jgi:hypothetical protein
MHSNTKRYPQEILSYWVRGGMSPCPPNSAPVSPFFTDVEIFAKLRQFLLEVRTFFAENPAE